MMFGDCGTDDVYGRNVFSFVELEKCYSLCHFGSMLAIFLGYLNERKKKEEACYICPVRCNFFLLGSVQDENGFQSG